MVYDAADMEFSKNNVDLACWGHNHANEADILADELILLGQWFSPRPCNDHIAYTII
jgi:hypothetical protein